MSDLNAFTVYRIHQRDGKIAAWFERAGLADLSPGEVVIRVSHSGINYKDALAATGVGRILRRFPLVGGIDLAGTVETSSVKAYRSGDPVLVTGCGLSETRDGGYGEYARVPAEAVIPIPAGFDAASAMAVGTAGFAAALAIMRMEANAQAPQMGPIAVTGATGGVGSIAIDMLAARGYEPVAITGKTDAADYLRAIGAARIVPRADIRFGTTGLEAERWGGAIDNAGGDLLAWLLRTTRARGNVASVGLTAGAQLVTTVMPFILRGINLLGINSSALPRALRLAVWQRIASDLRPRHLDRIVQRRIDWRELPDALEDLLGGRSRGRTLVQIQMSSPITDGQQRTGDWQQ